MVQKMWHDGLFMLVMKESLLCSKMKCHYSYNLITKWNRCLNNAILMKSKAVMTWWKQFLPWLNESLFAHKMTEPCWTPSSLICDDFQKCRASLYHITVPKHSLFCHLQNYGPIYVFLSCEGHFRLVIFLSTTTFHVPAVTFLAVDGAHLQGWTAVTSLTNRWRRSAAAVLSQTLAGPALWCFASMILSVSLFARIKDTVLHAISYEWFGLTVVNHSHGNVTAAYYPPNKVTYCY